MKWFNKYTSEAVAQRCSVKTVFSNTFKKTSNCPHIVAKKLNLITRKHWSNVGKEMVVDLIDCNLWFTSQHSPPPPSLHDSERKWKQKDCLVKQRWYIYNVSKLQVLANVQICSHITTPAQNPNFQTDTNLSDVRFLSKISLVTKLD